MTEIRNLLDIAAEYSKEKDSVDMYPDLISEQEAEARLNAIALRFKTVLNTLTTIP